MGKILFFIFIILLSPTVLGRGNITSNAFLSMIPDSVKNLVGEHAYIFYSAGHHSHVWSLVFKDDNDYYLIRGRNNELISNCSESLENEPIENSFTVLSWAIDSMPEQSPRMSSVCTPSSIAGMYSVLLVIDSKGELMFEAENNTVFGGDSQPDFNYKYQKVLLLMKVLAYPGLLEYIPDSYLKLGMN